VIRIEKSGGVCLIRMDDGKANAMNPAFLAELDRALEDCGKSGGRAIVLTGARNIFSAGLDLPLLSGFDRDRMSSLLRSFHDVMLKVFTWPGPVVAAINGHALAGGCVLAMQADARMMARGGFRFGVTELALGVALPAVAIETFRIQLGGRELARAALEARSYTPEEALAGGLVDELAEPGAVEAAAMDQARELSRLPPEAYARTKAFLRRPAVEAAGRNRDDDLRGWLDVWFSEPARQLVAAAVQRLRTPKP
jgi:enoyl-CoA hydratase